MKEDAERFIANGAQAIGDGNWDAYGKLFSEDLAMRTPGLPGIIKGRQARVELVQGMLAPFPDGRIDVVRIISEGEWACFELRFSGTHTEPMPTPDGGAIAPTNKAVDSPYCIVARFEEGVVTEMNEYYDQLEMMAQLGIG